MVGETTVTLVGNLTADPELRTISSGASVASFTIASTPRTFNRNSNQWEDGQALFMRCSAWRELAAHVAQSLSKGTRVIAQGRLNQRSYQAQDGSNRTVVEMTVDEIGPSLRYATAQVTRQGNASGFSGNNRGGFVADSGSGPNSGNASGGYQGGAAYSAHGAVPNASGAQPPAADPWGTPASSGEGFSSFGANSEFSGDSDEPEF